MVRFGEISVWRDITRLRNSDLIVKKVNIIKLNELK